ncbi:hypothetical protein BVI2075_280021 [Burkholderia vietnamiensis]|nr:hypothetical protein BVI2075_280021 [Burkholderia vietnamiensis]
MIVIKGHIDRRSDQGGLAVCVAAKRLEYSAWRAMATVLTHINEPMRELPNLDIGYAGSVVQGA